MRAQAKTQDPDRAFLLYQTILERDRITAVIRDWLMRTDWDKQSEIRAAVADIVSRPSNV